MPYGWLSWCGPLVDLVEEAKIVRPRRDRRAQARARKAAKRSRR